jgi:hypothetical protein
LAVLAAAAWALKALPFAACSCAEDTGPPESLLNPSKAFDERSFTPLGFSICDFTAVTLEYITMCLPSTNKSFSYRLLEEAVTGVKECTLVRKTQIIEIYTMQVRI